MATQANFYPNLKQCACPDRWYTHVLGLFLFSGWAVPLMAGGAPWSLAVGALWLVGYIAVCMNAYDEKGPCRRCGHTDPTVCGGCSLGLRHRNCPGYTPGRRADTGDR